MFAPRLDRCGLPLHNASPRLLSRELLRHSFGRRSREASLQNEALQGDLGLGRRDRRGEMILYACVAPMHPWFRVHESSGLLVSYSR